MLYDCADVLHADRSLVITYTHQEGTGFLVVVCVNSCDGRIAFQRVVVAPIDHTEAGFRVWFGKPNIELALGVRHQQQRERPDELDDCDFVWLFALAAFTVIALELIDWDDLLIVPNPCNVVPTAGGNQVKVHSKIATYYVL